MNKELVALNHVRNRCCDYLSLSLDNDFCDNIKIIENALKDYENTKAKLDDTQSLLWKNKKKLEAFEIIKEKNVCIHDLIKLKTLEEYNGCREWEEELIQEEFDALKEVLL